MPRSSGVSFESVPGQNCPKVQDRRFDAAVLHLTAVSATARALTMLQQTTAQLDPRTACATFTNNQRQLEAEPADDGQPA